MFHENITKPREDDGDRDDRAADSKFADIATQHAGEWEERIGGPQLMRPFHK